MTFFLGILDWCALAPGLGHREQWRQWSRQPLDDWSSPLPPTPHLSMMMARRMSVPSRLSVEVGMTLLEQQPDAAVFVSRHGELERTYKIIESLCRQQDVSPTDFAMSVHNTAAGLLTIGGKAPLPMTSLAAGIDGFQQGLLEAQAILSAGAQKVMLVDFDGAVPEAYCARITHTVPAYAVGLLITQGQELRCRAIEKASRPEHEAGELPQSLVFLRHYLTHQNLAKESSFIIEGAGSDWQWNL